MVRLNNSHSQESGGAKTQTLPNFRAWILKKTYNVSPNQKISICLKLKQIPLIKGLCFLKNIHFGGFIMNSSSYPVL